MFGLYPKNAPLSWGFNKMEIRNLFHENKLGGLVNVSHRYIDTNNPKAPKAARIAPNGDPYSYFGFYDFNR